MPSLFLQYRIRVFFFTTPILFLLFVETRSETITLPFTEDLGAEISHAEIHFAKATLVKSPKAVLVLCPGMNTDGARWFANGEWEKYALEQGFVLCAIDFVSPSDLLLTGEGYFNAEKVSGNILLKALKSQGLKETPILLFGFSAGAWFVDSFVRTYPEKVMAYAAFSARKWPQPVTGPDMKRIPAIIGCGDLDATRLGACVAHFQAGRRLGLPWAWLSMPDTGHHRTTESSRLVEAFFAEVATLTESPTETGVYFDNQTLRELKQEKAQGKPYASWFPSGRVAGVWLQAHKP